MKIEEFMKSELCARILMKDKDVGLDNQDLETLFRDKEEVSAFTGIADGERNVQLAVEAVLENIKFNGKEKKFERAILMIEGDLTMQDVSEGLDIMREEMVTSDTDLIFGSKYVENSEKRVRVDAIMV